MTQAVSPDVDPAPSDADLVMAARTGEPSAAGVAFGTLIRRYERLVHALAVSLVGDPTEASDAVQEAFLRAFRNLDLLADPARFGVWLRRIAFGVCIDHVRAARARRRLVIAAADAPSLDEANPHDGYADEAPSALALIERAEVVDQILAALDRMPARYRIPFTLYHIDGLSHAKVARALAVPEGTVRSLVARARRKLATLLASTPEVIDMKDEVGLRGPLEVLDERLATSPRLLHVLNGDVVRSTLERSEVPGAFAPYADVLHDGPVPRATGTAAWRDVRARFIGGNGYAAYQEALRIYEAWDASLDRADDYDEVVLWFEHDLFDQLLLVRHLDWFARRPSSRATLSLICVGEFPGFARFDGLGQLDANQLASLLGTRERVSRDQLALGQRVWEAFTAPDPAALDAIAREPESVTPLLPYLPGALRRLLGEYPDVAGGLPLTERRMLECLAHGPVSTHDLFRAEQGREERVFMGDWTFWRKLRALGDGTSPLVSLDVAPGEGPDLPRGTVAMTDLGGAVLAGRADWVALAGFDGWVGGVHLVASPGGDVAWRYDAATGGLVPRAR